MTLWFDQDLGELPVELRSREMAAANGLGPQESLIEALFHGPTFAWIDQISAGLPRLRPVSSPRNAEDSVAGNTAGVVLSRAGQTRSAPALRAGGAGR